jgi:hypothetical protein
MTRRDKIGRFTEGTDGKNVPTVAYPQRKPFIRPVSIPDPDSCGHCGKGRNRSHGMIWSRTLGYHQWIAPTDAQRKDRMLARRAERFGLNDPEGLEGIDNA